MGEGVVVLMFACIRGPSFIQTGVSIGIEGIASVNRQDARSATVGRTLPPTLFELRRDPPSTASVTTIPLGTDRGSLFSAANERQWGEESWC